MFPREASVHTIFVTLFSNIKIILQLKDILYLSKV